MKILASLFASVCLLTPAFAAPPNIVVIVADDHGYADVTFKEGVPHVQPPVGLLEQMLSVRLHLDDADSTNGALRVLPGTHRLGRLNAEAIQSCRETLEEVSCETKTGGVLLMRPLLLHASSRSTSECRRRVLHIEFAGFDLPAPLDWHERAGPLYARAAIG